MFYTYRWIRKDNNTVFYVGKGEKNRYLQQHNSRNKHFVNILKSTDCYSEIVCKFESSELAFNHEIELIKYYKSKGECCANYTNGGEGNKGLVHSKESRQKISESLFKAKFRHTEEFKQKMKQLKKATAKPVETLCGIKFDSIKEAAKHIKTSAANIRENLKGNIAQIKGFSFTYTLKGVG